MGRDIEVKLHSQDNGRTEKLQASYIILGFHESHHKEPSKSQGAQIKTTLTFCTLTVSPAKNVEATFLTAESHTICGGRGRCD